MDHFSSAAFRVFFIISIMAFQVHGQKSNKKFPFQVLEAKGVSNGKSSVSDLDYLNNSDELTLEAGQLILVHYSGRFFEYKGDTTISISNLSQGITTDPKRYVRPGISILYSEVFDLTSMFPQFEPIKIISPYRNLLEVSNGNFCFSWISDIEREYILEMKNRYGDVVKTHQLSTTSIVVDLSEIGEPVILFKIKDAKNPKDMSKDYAINIVDDVIGVPNNSCIMDSSVQALMTGFHLEQNRNFEKALEAFEMASELSERPIFTTFLNNFLARHKGD